MNTHNQQEPQFQIVNALQSVMESASALANIFSKTVEEMFKIQSASGTTGITETLPNLVPTLSNAGPTHLLWQVPTLYQAQSQRAMKTMLDSIAALSHAQQQMLEWANQCLSRHVQQTTHALSQLTGTWANRRESAEIISFSDRRTQLQAKSYAEAERAAAAAHHRASRGAAAA